jgi:hypothetical protein
MRKGFIYFDTGDQLRVKPTLGQYQVYVNTSGLLEVINEQGTSVTQTQFVGTGGTTPGQYLPLTGGVVTGTVLFKDEINVASSFSADTIFSGSTDLSDILNSISTPGGPYLPISGGTGGPYTFTGNTNFTGLIQSGGTNLSTYFENLKNRTWNMSNYTTLDQATDFPSYIITSPTSIVTTGDLYYLKSDGTWSLADASTSGTSIGLLGIPNSINSSTGMLLEGCITLDTTDFTGTPALGAVLYVSETAGNFTFDPPTTSGAVVRAIGYYVQSVTVGRSAAYVIYFRPSTDYLILA